MAGLGLAWQRAARHGPTRPGLARRRAAWHRTAWHDIEAIRLAPSRHWKWARSREDGQEPGKAHLVWQLQSRDDHDAAARNQL